MEKGVSKYYFFLGFLGFLGLKGLNNNPLYFFYFAFGGYFSHFWWSKLSHFEDKYLMSNKYKAGSISYSICLALAFAISIIVYLSPLDLYFSYKLQILIISLTFPIATNLWALLTYKFCVVG